MAFGVLAYSVNLAFQNHAFVNQLTTVRGIHIGDSRDRVKYRLGYLAAASQWGHSFARLWAVTRAALWRRLDWGALLKSYGTAAGIFRMLGTPEQAPLPGMG